MPPEEATSTENSEATSLNNEEESQENQVTDEMVTKVTHNRVLGESRKYKQRMINAEAKVKEAEDTRLTDQQKYKEAYERTKVELESEKKSKAHLQLKTQLIPALSKAGCIEITDAMKLGNNDFLIQDPDSDSLDGVDAYVKDLKQNKPYLFVSGKSSSVNESLPAPGKPQESRKNKLDFSHLTKAEVQTKLRELG